MFGLMRESTSNGKQARGQTQEPVGHVFSAAGSVGMFRMHPAIAWLLLHYVCHQQFLFGLLYRLTFFMRVKLLISSFDVS